MCKDGGVKGRRVASCFWASSCGGAGGRGGYVLACSLALAEKTTVLHFRGFERLFLV